MATDRFDPSPLWARVRAALAIVGAASCIALALQHRASGTPRFAQRSGQDCLACHADLPDPEIPQRDKRCTLTCIGCHVNPLGGGMRREGGVRFSNFSLPWHRSDPESPRSGRLSDTITVGLDFRQMNLFPRLDAGPGASAERSFFFPMQNDLYVRWRIHPHLSAVTDLYTGAFPTEPTRPREMYALADDLPWNSWAMAGYFVPPFGLKLDDHTIVTRRDLGFGPLSSDAGFAVGAASGRPYFDLAVMNGVPISTFANQAGAIANPADRKYKLFSGHLGYFDEAVHGGLTWHLNLTEPLRAGDPPTIRRMLGLYHTGTYGPLTWMTELDVRETDNPDPLPLPFHSFPGRGTDPYLTHDLSAFAEFSWLVHDGLSINLAGDWRDPQWEKYDDAGAARTYRGIFSASWYPAPFVEILGYYRAGFASDKYVRSDVFFQLHLFL